MHWTISAAFTIAALAAADLLIKATTGKISNSLALLLYGSCTFLAGLSWVVVQTLRKEAFFAQPAAIATGLAVGLAFTCVTFGLYATFVQLPVSVASPLIRVGAIVVVSLVGVLLFKEKLSPIYLVGMALTLTGLILLIVHSATIRG